MSTIPEKSIQIWSKEPDLQSYIVLKKKIKSIINHYLKMAYPSPSSLDSVAFQRGKTKPTVGLK